MSRNLIAGLLVSALSAIISILVVPTYLHYLGVESYGLIGFFGALQALFAVLDLGMTPTINREVARGLGTGDFAEARTSLATLSRLFWVVAMCIAITSVVLGPLVATKWVHAQHLPQEVVERAVIIMGLILASRWPGGVYGSVLAGGQRVVLGSIIGAISLVISSVGAIIVLKYVAPTLDAFYIWAGLVGIAQVAVTRHYAWRLLGGRGGARFEIATIRRLWRFSAGLSIANILSLLFLQSDKIVLSRVVSLTDLGVYTLAGVGSRILYLVLTPVFTVIYPRMSAMVVSNDIEGLPQIYRNGTRLLMGAICPAAAYITLLASELFQIWTGNRQLAQIVPPTMMLLTLGTAFNGASHFTYALQLAYGNARVPIINAALLLVTFLPLVVGLSLRYGIVGAAAAWCIVNFASLIWGAWLTHRTMLPGLALRWLISDVAMPTAVSIAIVGGGYMGLREAGLGGPMLVVTMMIFPILALLTVVRLTPGLYVEARARVADLRLVFAA